MRIRNPAFYLTGVILQLAWGTIGLILTRQFDSFDAIATEKVAREKDLDVEPVDMNIPRKVSEVSPAVTVFSRTIEGGSIRLRLQSMPREWYHHICI